MFTFDKGSLLLADPTKKGMHGRKAAVREKIPHMMLRWGNFRSGRQ